MDEAPRRASRRSFIERAGLLIGAALGSGAVVGGARVARGDDDAQAAGPAPGRKTTLYTRNWHAVAPGRRFGERPQLGETMHLHGELVDRFGKALGELRGTATSMATPFTDSSSVQALVETHVLALTGGTILGMGTVVGEENVFAILGGTGRYAGARGSYSARSRPNGLGGDGAAEIILDLKG